MKYAKTGFIAFLIYGSLHIILYAQEWEWENTLLEGSNAAYTIIQTEYDNILYAGTGRNGKIFKSIDNGETWETAGDLENATSIYKIIQDNITGIWYAAATLKIGINYYGAVFKSNSQLSIVNTQKSWPSLKYSIYPNPARQGSITRLNINLPLNANISELKIYNVLGQLIKNINVSQIKSGVNTNIDIWDGKNTYNKTTSNGIYFLYMTIVDANGKRISNNGIKLIYIQ